MVDAEFQRLPMPGQLSRRSSSVSTLPITRSRSNVRFTVDDELGSPYSTKSLSSLRGSHPLRPSRTRAKRNYLADIEVSLCMHSADATAHRSPQSFIILMLTDLISLAENN